MQAETWGRCQNSEAAACKQETLCIASLIARLLIFTTRMNQRMLAGIQPACHVFGATFSRLHLIGKVKTQQCIAYITYHTALWPSWQELKRPGRLGQAQQCCLAWSYGSCDSRPSGHTTCHEWALQTLGSKAYWPSSPAAACPAKSNERKVWLSWQAQTSGVLPKCDWWFCVRYLYLIQKSCSGYTYKQGFHIIVGVWSGVEIIWVKISGHPFNF